MAKIAKPLIAALVVLALPLSHAENLKVDAGRRIAVDSSGLRHIELGNENSINTYSAYGEAVRVKLERVGNFQMPTSLKSTPWSLSVTIDVAIKSDGSLYSVTIVRTSGNAVFDESAIRAVNQAAPFAPFPETMANEVDVVHMRRTWLYHQGA